MLDNKISLLSADTLARTTQKLGLINGDLVPTDYGIKVLSVSKGLLYTEAINPIEDNRIIIYYGQEEGDKIQLRPLNKDCFKELNKWYYGKPFKINNKELYIQNSYLTRYNEKYVIEVYLMDNNGVCLSDIHLDNEFFKFL